MKFRKVVCLCAAMLAMSATAYAEEAVETEVETEVVTETAAEAAAGALSDDWTDFQVQIDDEVYQFPMMCKDFMAYGWTCEEAAETQLAPYEYSGFTFRRGTTSCYVYLLNYGINTVSAEKCIVGGLSVDKDNWESAGYTITLPGGIVGGVADQAAIEAAYGTPNDVYEGDLYTELTYSMDSYEDMDLYVYKESGVLEEINIRNFAEPEGFDGGEVSEEVPADVAAYVKPDALSEDMSAYEIEIAGSAYSLPVPVSALLADGWELNEDDSDSYVAADYYGWVYLRKDNQEMMVSAYNYEDYATVPANCWVKELTVGGYDLEMDGALPGGVRIGITEDELIAILEANDIAYEVEDSSDTFRYYTYNQVDYDKQCEVMVYKADNGQFTKDTVTSVTCRNE